MIMFVAVLIALAPTTLSAHRVPKGIPAPNAMVVPSNKYQSCLNSNTNVSSVPDRAAFKKAVERGIAACAARRAELVKEADIALMRDPDYQSDSAKRAKAVAAAFDTQDAIQHAMGDGRILYEGE